MQRSPIGAVVAGSGYGKSTVVAQWVTDRHMPCAWYAMVPNDDEPYRFVSHLLAAAAELHVDGPLSELLSSGFTADRWRSALDVALNALAEFGQRCVVVLDDVHHLREPAAVEALVYFIRFLPASASAVLTSRHVPEFSAWTSWVVRGLTDVLDAAELALTADEAAELLPGTEVAPIMALTGGWPLAVDCLALRRTLPLPASREALQDLILTEVWDHLSADEQEFLLQCSLQDVLRGSVSMLERLSQQGAFVRRWPDGTYRIHDVFRDFLRARIERDPPRAVAGHRAAATALMAQSAPLEAVPHLIAAGDEAEAAALLETQGGDLLARGRHKLLLDLLGGLRALPFNLLLLSAHAWRQAGQYEAALQRFQQAADGADRPGLAQALYGQAQVYIDTLQPNRASDLLRQAYRLAPSSTLLNAIAENALNQGRAHAAARYRRLALRSPGTPTVWEARIWLRTGQLQTARTVLRERLAASAERAPGAHRDDALVLSYIAAVEGEAEEAETLARQALERAQRQGSQPTEAVAWMRLGHALQLNDDAGSSAAYRKAIELVGPVERLKAEALMGQALATREVGLATEGLQIAQRAGDAWMAAWLRLSLGVVAADSAVLGQAREEFRQVRDRFGEAVASLWLHDARTLEAPYRFLLERRTLFGPPPAPEPVAAGRLRVHCLGAFRVLRDGVPLPPRAWKREKARELFLALVTRRNRLLQKEELMDVVWPDATPQAANRDFRVALHAASDALDPDRPKHALASCLERQGTAYGFQTGERCGLDVEDFERFLDQAARSSGAEALRWRLKAMELYGGDYLEEFPYHEWAEGERERLRARFLEAGERAAKEALAQGEDETALTAAYALLAREKAWEAAWQVIIRVHRRQGRDFMARRAYEQCTEALRDELGVTPSTATEALLGEDRRTASHGPA
jgi:DNA-binding SARP family transcriptional activator